MTPEQKAKELYPYVEEPDVVQCDVNEITWEKIEAFLSGYQYAQEWTEFKEGQPLPDYDEPVMWLTEDGNVYVEALDKDGNPWTFPEEREGTDWPDYPKVTHWKHLPELPPNKETKP